MANNKNTTIIVRRINEAAKKYKAELVGKTFLIIFEDHYIEVSFRIKNFLHLCGVDTTLKNAADFYKKAASKGGLNSNEIAFSSKRPFSLADIKTQNLQAALDLFSKEIFVATDLFTQTNTYAIGTTDLKIIICIDSDRNRQGQVISNILVPRSLRVEYLKNSRCANLYEVDFVLKKDSNDKLYSELIYGNPKDLCKLKDDIKAMIEESSFSR
jgi:hypothetical protein